MGAALVTGASRGIGLAIAERLLASGLDVALVARKERELAAAARRLGEAFPAAKVAAIAENVGHPEAAERIFSAAAAVGPVTVLINNAATNPYYGPLAAMDPATMDKVYQVNLRAPLLLTQRFAAQLPEGTQGAVVNLASIGGMAVEPGLGFYNVLKAGLIHLTRQLAGELGPRIRVNSVSPGLVRTDFARALWEPMEGRLAGRLPSRRIGEPADIAAAAAFLASPEAAWITGANLVVDGGNLAVPMF